GTAMQLGGTTPGLGLPVVGGLSQAMRGAFMAVVRPEAIPVRNEWFYWNPTRVIPEAITEFPFFTFLYGDLHAHMLALPYTIVALGLAANVALGLSSRRAVVPRLVLPVDRPVLVGSAAGVRLGIVASQTALPSPAEFASVWRRLFRHQREEVAGSRWFGR